MVDEGKNDWISGKTYGCMYMTESTPSPGESSEKDWS